MSTEIISADLNRKEIAKFRPDNEVLLRIVNHLSEGRMKKTRLHLISRVNWNSFEKYLTWLMDNNYLDYQDDGEGTEYFLTLRGEELSRRLSRFLEYTNTSRYFTAT